MSKHHPDHPHSDHGHHSHARHEHCHGHHHGHSHHHAPANFGRAFAIGIALNLAFVLIEAFYGWQSGSLALLADAGHNLGDVGGLMLAWAALAAARITPDVRHSYGWRRGSILAGFLNAVLLLGAMAFLLWEAVERFRNPLPVGGVTVMVVAAIGVLINGFTAMLFMAGGKDDLNIRGAFLHMAADALVSVGVVLAGAVYLWRGWMWIDPLMSVIIALIIVAGTWSLFRQSLHLLFDGVPEQINLPAVRQCLMAIDGVADVHDLHVWALGTSELALTAHLVVADAHADREGLLRFALAEMQEDFGIRHATFQLESAAFARECALGQTCLHTPA